jgi:hypothetical protein
MELRGLYCGEGIQKWLVLIFESFGIVTEGGGSVSTFAKGTEVRKGTGTRGIIRRHR